MEQITVTQYNFTHNWTEPFIRNATRHLIPLKDRPLKYLEIGVFEGRSLCWMAENVLLHSDSIGIGIDTWTKDDEFKRAEQNCWQHKQIGLIRSSIVNEARNFPENHFDVIYIDGDHMAIPVMTDTVLAWPLLRKGGIMIWDDTEWPQPQYQVTDVLKWFLPRVRHESLAADKQAWVRKQ